MSLSNQLPLVSIALATYNGGQYLPQQLDSLLEQTYKPIEIIAVDDKSTDNTVAILERYKALHPQIKVYVNEDNVGYVKNFEKIISLCGGEYVAMCDQDDVWLPQKIQRKVEAIGKYPMIYCDSFIVDNHLQKTGKKISDAVVCQTFTSCLNYAVYANVYGHAWMFKRSLFLSAPPFPLCITHDWWLAYNAVIQGGVKFLSEPLVLYRQHDKNQFGIIGKKGKLHNKHTKNKITADARERMNLFYDLCPAHLQKQKSVLLKLKKSYSSFSLYNNFLRTITFFQNYKALLAVRKRNTLRKLLFCFKMFAKLK